MSEGASGDSIFIVPCRPSPSHAPVCVTRNTQHVLVVVCVLTTIQCVCLINRRRQLLSSLFSCPSIERPPLSAVGSKQHNTNARNMLAVITRTASKQVGARRTTALLHTAARRINLATQSAAIEVTKRNYSSCKSHAYAVPASSSSSIGTAPASTSSSSSSSSSSSLPLPEVLHTIAEVRALHKKLQKEGQTLGFVPTMVTTHSLTHAINKKKMQNT